MTDRRARPTFSKAVQRALVHHRAGRVSEAEALYRDRLRRDGTDYDAAYLLSALLVDQGQVEAALPHLATALAVRPGDAAALRLNGIALARLGRLLEALAIFDMALAAQPRAAELHNDRGTVLQTLGRPAESLAAYDQALGCDPGLGQAHNNRGNALSDLGRPEAALASYDAAIACDPGLAEAHNNRGNALKALKRSGLALASYERALALWPAYAAAHNNRGTALHELGRLPEALASYDAAIGHHPGFAEAHHNKATVLADLAQVEAALAACDAALALAPADPTILTSRGNILKRLGRHEDALGAYAAAGPGHAAARADRGLLLVELGQVEEGCAALEGAIALAPRTTRFFYNLTQCRRFRADDPLITPMTTLAAAAASLPVRDRIDLHFGLGKVFDDIGRFDTAFEHLALGNRLQRAATRYDEAATLGALAGLLNLEARSGPAESSGHGPRPVFILGMPRAGSTLVEQILAGHPQVHAAGETDALAQALHGLGTEGQRLLRTGVATSGPDNDLLRSAGAAYRRRLQERAPQALVVTNKMPDNFRLVGLIRLMLPEARIIHTRRHPLDTCLSCFATRFTGHQPFTYDLAELGRYYKAYAAAMRHWHEMVPRSLMLEVDYERVIANPEIEARRLVAHCGFAWDERCLQFHAVRRPVFTASFGQVREPLYRRAVGRWKAYAAHLRPLQEELGPLVADRDATASI